MQTRKLLLPIAALLFGAPPCSAIAQPVGDAPGAAGVGAAHTRPCGGKPTRHGSKGTQSGDAPKADSAPCARQDSKSAPEVRVPGSAGTQSGHKAPGAGTDSQAMPDAKPTIPAAGPGNTPAKP